MAGLASRIDGLLDWLVDVTGGDTVSTEVNSTKRNHDYVYAEFWRVVFFVCSHAKLRQGYAGIVANYTLSSCLGFTDH